MEQVLKLKTEAKTQFRNRFSANSATTFKPAVLVSKNRGWVFRIVDTPGSWYMDTLLGKDGFNSRVGNRISIQGDDWYCINMDELLKEAEELIKPLSVRFITGDSYEEEI